MAAPAKVFVAVASSLGAPDEGGKVGVFRRPVPAGEWQHVLSHIEAFNVSVHPHDPQRIFAGTADGVWSSDDGGANFKRANFPDSDQQIWSFLVDGSNADRIYAGGSPLAIYRSDDRGESWQRLPDPGIGARVKAPFAVRVMRMAQHPAKPEEIYAALEINGVIRSADGGKTWQDCSADLIRLAEQPHLKSKIVSDSFAEGMLDAHAVSITPHDPGAVLVALRMGLFRSTNQGRQWQDLEIKRYSPLAYARDLKVSPHEPNTIYAALSEAAQSHRGAIYRSQDSGNSWHRFDRVEVRGTVMSIALHHSDPQQLYLAGRYAGEVFGTADGGRTWTPMPLAGPVRDIYCVACG